MVYSQKSPDTRLLSTETGYLFAVYLKMKKLADEINQVCRILEQSKPWLDPKLHKTTRVPNAQGTCISKKSSVKSTSNV